MNSGHLYKSWLKHELKELLPNSCRERRKWRDKTCYTLGSHFGVAQEMSGGEPTSLMITGQDQWVCFFPRKMTAFRMAEMGWHFLFSVVFSVPLTSTCPFPASHKRQFILLRGPASLSPDLNKISTEEKESDLRQLTGF